MIRFSTALVCALLFATASLAGPGHDHGDGGPAPAAGADMPRLESAGSDFELVATAEGHKLTIYLDRLQTNEPVDGATIEISGDGIAAIKAKPVAEGTYEIEAEWVDEPGVKALIFTITVGDTIDLLNGTLDVHGPDKAEAATPVKFSDVVTRPELWVFAGIALLVGFFAAFAFRSARTPPEGAPGVGTGSKPTLVDAAAKHMKHAAELVLVAVLLGLLFSTSADAHEGHDEGPAPTTGNVPRRLPSGEAFVPKPSQRLLRIRTSVAATENAQQGTELIGTVISNPSSAGHVQAPMDGQIELAERGISYVGQRVTTGEVLAALAPAIPVADLGTMEQLRADVDGKLRVAEQKLSRLTRVTTGVIAQSEIDDTRAELEALREQKRVLAPKGVEKILLKAPVSGVISVANVRAGQVVSLRDTLFEIVDPEQLWVEAIGMSSHGQNEVTGAHALDLEGHSIKLSYIGQSPTLRQQSLPLLFKVEGKHALAIGSTVKVIAQGGAGAKGIVLPDAAVVRGANGLPLVWEKVSAERFKPVNVRTVPLDGARVLVIAGIADGARVVVEGAEFINQIR